jgi:hypothetical protein
MNFMMQLGELYIPGKPIICLNILPVLILLSIFQKHLPDFQDIPWSLNSNFHIITSWISRNKTMTSM